MGHFLKLKCAHSPLNLRISSSTRVPFTLMTVQVPNLALSYTKRIAVYDAKIDIKFYTSLMVIKEQSQVHRSTGNCMVKTFLVCVLVLFTYVYVYYLFRVSRISVCFVISQSLLTILEAIFQVIIRYSNPFLYNSTDIQYTYVKVVFIRITRCRK
jgi:hypothetical protein